MIDPVPRKLNLSNLSYVFQRIMDLEAFIFFGTLLGYTRENNIIENDDDIDIYVNKKEYNSLLAALRATSFELQLLPKKKWYRWKYPFGTPLVLQATRMLENTPTFVDFYFYDDTETHEILERWNFKGQWKNPDSYLRTPKKLVYPIRSGKLNDIEVKIPHNPRELCLFLYGDTWQTPLKKREEYEAKIIANKPVIIYEN